MRRAVLGVLLFLSAGPACAQNGAQNGGSEIVIPPAPPLTPEVPSAPAPAQPAPPQPPPGLVQALPSTPPPAGDDGSTPAAPSTNPPLPKMPPAGTAALPPPPDVAPVQADSWAPGTTAVLAVLNEVDGSTSQLTIPVGAPAQTTGDLNINVQACMNRPPGQIPDAAVFLTVTPVQQGAAPLYNGWMVRSAPGTTVVGNAGQTFRVVGCS